MKSRQSCGRHRSCRVYCRWHSCLHGLGLRDRLRHQFFCRRRGRNYHHCCPCHCPHCCGHHVRRRGSKEVGCWLVFATDAVASTTRWGVAATSGLVVSSGGDIVVDLHEVGVFSKLGDDFACAVSLSLSCHRCDSVTTRQGKYHTIA
jgi:hypothetical protein